MTMQAVESQRKMTTPRNKKSRHAFRNAERVKTNPKRTLTAVVSSPTVPGATEKLEVVIDTVFAMRRRRQIDEPSWLAAETYRKAYDCVGARIGGVMDFDRVRGGGTGACYSQMELEAAETLSEAAKLLGMIDGRVVELIVGCNWTVAEAADHLNCTEGRLASAIAAHVALKQTGRAKRRDCEIAGERLRMGLRVLAEAWHPAPQPKLRGWRGDGAKPLGGRAGNRDIELGAVPMRRKI